MKRFIFIISVTLFISNALLAQNQHSQSKILEINYNNHKASNFGISNAKYIIAFEQKKYRMKIDAEDFDIQSMDKYQLKKERITSHISKIIFFDGSIFTTKSSHTYINNYKTLDKKIDHSKDGLDDQEYSYKFDKKGRMIEIIYSRKKDNEQSKEYIKHDDAAKTIEKFGFDYRGNKYGVLKFKTGKNGNIVEKLEIAKRLQPNDKKWSFEYDNNGNVIKAENGEISAKTKRYNTKGISSYKYNDKNLVVEESGNYSESDFNIKLENHYEYVYDKYNNWIAKYLYITNYSYQDLSSENYKNIIEIWLRKITYKNGDVTGETDEKATSVQNYLNEVVKNNPFKTKKPPKRGVYWSKPNEKQFRFYIDGVNKSRTLNFSVNNTNHFYTNDSTTNILYQLKDFKLKPIEKEFYKAIPIAKHDEVVWFKNGENNFYLIKNGKRINDDVKMTWASNNIDILIKKDDKPIYAMLNARNTILNSYQNAISYKEYLKKNPNEGKKEIIPDGFVWKKNSKNAFWFYENGVSIRTKLIANRFFNHEIVYDSINNRTFFFKEFADKEPNKYYNATKLNGNVFWFKTDKGYDIFKNGALFNFDKSKYAQNGKDVVVYSKEDTKLYVLKNYQKSRTYELLDIISYSDYTEKPSVAYIENKEIRNCKEENKCYANLFDKKVADILSDTSISNKDKAIANYMERIYTINPGMLQKVGMIIKTENLNHYIQSKKLLPQEIQNDIKNRSRKMLEDYNKYINSKEVRDKVKKNGGSIIRN